MIITIIVLLILAVVTISAVNEGNLFAHANNAATRYTAEAELENTKMSDWLTKMGQYDGGTVADPNNPLIGKNFSMFIGGTYYTVFKNITSNSLSYYDFSTGEWVDNAQYAYNDTQKIMNLQIDGEEEPFEVIILNNNIALVDFTGGFLTSNGGTNTSLLNGYSFIYDNKSDEDPSDDDILYFLDNNVATVRENEYFYAVADDNSSNSGTYYLYISNMAIFNITKVNGIYTEVTFPGEGTVELIPPQP